MKSFDFKKSYEELKIDGEIYKIDLSDDKVKEYQRAFVDFQVKSQELQIASDKAITPELKEEFMDKSKALVGETIDLLLGGQSFNKLYESSGRSLINMIDLVLFLTEIIQSKTEELKSSTLEKYIKK
jgi:hypothetical protein